MESSYEISNVKFTIDPKLEKYEEVNENNCIQEELKENLKKIVEIKIKIEGTNEENENRATVIQKVKQQQKLKVSKDLNKVKRFIWDSIEFKSCVKKRDLKGCWKKFCQKYKNSINERQFKEIFKKELNHKLQKMCRVCLRMDENIFQNIFSKLDCHDEPISNIITSFVPLKITKEEDQLPQLICENCLKKIDILLDFRKLCIDSDCKLRKNTVVKLVKINHSNEEFKNFQEIQKKSENFFDNDDGDDESDLCENQLENVEIKLESEDGDTFETNELANENVDQKVELGIDNIKIYRQYEHQKNKLINKFGKKLGEPCGCVKNCYRLIGIENIKLIFKKYWNLKRMNVQSSYLHSCIIPKQVAYRRAKNQHSKRKLTFFYRIKVNGKYIKVCRKAFINIHGVTLRRIRGVCGYMVPSFINKTIPIDEDSEKIVKNKDDLIQMNFDEENVIEKDKKVGEDLPDDMISTYKCNVCDKIFVNKRTYNMHKATKKHFTEIDLMKKQQKRCHKPNEKGEYTCVDCGKIFLEFNKYKNHVGYYHTLKHTCEKCGEIFDSIRKFRNHMYKHTGIRHLSCDECGRTYYSQDILRKHKRAKHEKQSFLCNFCSRSFSDLDLLEKHITNKHKCYNF